MIQIVLTVATILSTLSTIIILTLPKQYEVNVRSESSTEEGARNSENHETSVQVLVLGDIGRSPRMQYHALSIARHGGSVQMIGYIETEPLPELRALANVKIIPLSATPKYLQTSNKILFLALAPLKVVHQIWNLWQVLGYQTTASRWLLVQNPPSIPTLLVATLVCFLRHTRLVIDWHNFGYSILALKLGEGHAFVRASLLYEKFFAQAAHSHFAVTNVMARLLQNGFVRTRPVMTLHDRPAAIFQPISSNDRLTFLSQHPLTATRCMAIVQQQTKLIVSSTSWTPDEDFSVLLDALRQYSTAATSTPSRLPELYVVITGKGPQQAYYKGKIEQLKKAGELEKVAIETAWLNFHDYAKLLAAADLGVSLHTSSSGVDLPMKVVDMFGAGLPVLGFDNYKAWTELVTEGVNGRGFADAKQMFAALQELFGHGNVLLEKLRQGAMLESKRRWDAEWDPVAGHLFGFVDRKR